MFSLPRSGNISLFPRGYIGHFFFIPQEYKIIFLDDFGVEPFPVGMEGFEEWIIMGLKYKYELDCGIHTGLSLG